MNAFHVKWRRNRLKGPRHIQCFHSDERPVLLPCFQKDMKRQYGKLLTNARNSKRTSERVPRPRERSRCQEQTRWLQRNHTPCQWSGGLVPQAGMLTVQRTWSHKGAEQWAHLAIGEIKGDGVSLSSTLPYRLPRQRLSLFWLVTLSPAMGKTFRPITVLPHPCINPETHMKEKAEKYWSWCRKCLKREAMVNCTSNKDFNNGISGF